MTEVEYFSMNRLVSHALQSAPLPTGAELRS